MGLDNTDPGVAMEQISLKVISAEDSAGDYQLIQHYLRKHFPLIQLVKVTNLRHLEDELKVNSYDVILLDLYLGVDNTGFIIPELKTQFPKTEIVVITGEDDIKIALNCISEGTSYIVKGPQLETDLIKIFNYLAKLLYSQEALDQILNNLTDSNDRLSRFVYHISHDLKQPLRTINNFISLLDQDIGSAVSGESLKYFELIKNGSVRMQDMIGSLSDYANIRSTVQTFELLDIQEIIEDVQSAELKSLIEVTAAKIEIRDQLPKLKGDKKLLHQVFHGILSNAIHYRKPNTTPIVNIRGFRSENSIRIEFEDNGRGIDPKFHERIFEIFIKIHTEPSDTGQGVTLAFIKEIMLIHHGKIEVSSTLGNGATFSLIFPTKDSESINETGI